jgi:hypothetical protein
LCRHCSRAADRGNGVHAEGSGAAPLGCESAAMPPRVPASTPPRPLAGPCPHDRKPHGLPRSRAARKRFLTNESRWRCAACLLRYGTPSPARFPMQCVPNMAPRFQCRTATSRMQPSRTASRPLCVLCRRSETPLQNAAQKGHAPVVKLLLAHGANPKVGSLGCVTRMGRSPCAAHDRRAVTRCPCSSYPGTLGTRVRPDRKP